jgi:hypothetical protein
VWLLSLHVIQGRKNLSTNHHHQQAARFFLSVWPP